MGVDGFNNDAIDGLLGNWKITVDDGVVIKMGTVLVEVGLEEVVIVELEPEVVKLDLEGFVIAELELEGILIVEVGLEV